jgi:hypothetical protein
MSLKIQPSTELILGPKRWLKLGDLVGSNRLCCIESVSDLGGAIVHLHTISLFILGKALKIYRNKT